MSKSSSSTTKPKGKVSQVTEDPWLRNQNSELTLILQAISAALDQEEGTLKDLPRIAKQRMAELKKLRKRK